MNAANAGMTTGSNIMGTPTQWNAGANSSLNTGISALNTGFNNQMSGYNANQQSSGGMMQGIGSLIGGGLMVGKLAGI